MSKLADRELPNYTRGEEIFNMVSHITGGALGVAALVLCVIKAAISGNAWAIVSSSIYGFTMVVLYCLSSVYHGLRPSLGKKVLQVLDHCSIYFMIAGTYTPIVLVAMRPLYPFLAWIIFAFEWGITAIAVTLTAIDLKEYRAFSMLCYIVMGWGIVLATPYATEALSQTGFTLLLAGGFAYTLGAVLYGIGANKRWFHCIFHIFVLIGSALQFFAIYLFAI